MLAHQRLQLVFELHLALEAAVALELLQQCQLFFEGLLRAAKFGKFGHVISFGLVTESYRMRPANCRRAGIHKGWPG
ncbi:hypothetical protein D9M73_202020 [compost metagenome]